MEKVTGLTFLFKCHYRTLKCRIRIRSNLIYLMQQLSFGICSGQKLIFMNIFVKLNLVLYDHED